MTVISRGFDLKEINQNLLILLQFFMVSIKYPLLRYNREKIIKIYKVLKSDDFKVKNDKENSVKRNWFHILR